jgi:leader peptidase (prepilin peptidase)/N-methyltransferase
MSKDLAIRPASGATGTATGFALLFLAVLALARWGPGAALTPLAPTLLLGAALAVLASIDCLTLRLPDGITLPLIAAGIGVAWLSTPLLAAYHASAAVAGYAALRLVALAYERLRGRAGLGLGDAKLLAAAGAWLGLEGLPTVVLYAAGAALVSVALAALTGRRVAATTRIPFGPFLAFAIWLVWLYGPLA